MTPDIIAGFIKMGISIFGVVVQTTTITPTTPPPENIKQPAAVMVNYSTVHTK